MFSALFTNLHRDVNHCFYVNIGLLTVTCFIIDYDVTEDTPGVCLVIQQVVITLQYCS